MEDVDEESAAVVEGPAIGFENETVCGDRLCGACCDQSDKRSDQLDDDESEKASNNAGCEIYRVETVTRMSIAGTTRTIHLSLRPAARLDTMVACAASATKALFAVTIGGVLVLVGVMCSLANSCQGMGEGGGVNMIMDTRASLCQREL